MRERWRGSTLQAHVKVGNAEHVHLDSLSKVVASTLLLDDLDGDRQMTGRAEVQLKERTCW